MDIPEIKYHPQKSQAQNIEIVDLENLYARKNTLPHDPEKPHRVSFYMLLYIQKGKGKHFIDFSDHSFKEGSFIFINKNQIHAFDLKKHPQGKVVLFTDAFIEGLQINTRAPLFTPMQLDNKYEPVFDPDKKLKESCQSLLLEIDKESKKEDSDDFIIMFLFSTLLLMLARARHQLGKKESTKNNERKVSHFLNLLDNNYAKTRDATDYAEKMHITYKTLNQACKQTTGKTAKQLIDSYMLLEAKRRLVIDKQPIQQLAFDLGFDDASNFVKYFKRHTGETPTHFQKRAKS